MADTTQRKVPVTVHVAEGLYKRWVRRNGNSEAALKLAIAHCLETSREINFPDESPLPGTAIPDSNWATAWSSRWGDLLAQDAAKRPPEARQPSL